MLVVEDDPVAARTFARILRARSVRAEAALTVDDALHKLDRLPTFDAIILDLIMDGRRRGEEVLDAVEPSVPVVVVTADKDPVRWSALLKRGAVVVPKPFDNGALVDTMGWLLARQDAVAQLAEQARLSPQETRILRLAREGLSAKEVAAKLGCAHSTVLTHWSRIQAKTGCRSQCEVLARLLRLRPNVK